MTNTNPARGMRDFLPEQIRKRNYVIGIIREVYEKYGFEPLETPTIENLSTLTNKYGEEGDQLMFKILKRGEKLQKKLEAGEVRHENELTDLALRYDLTVPLARVIANYRHQLPKFFKRYQIQPVWRADRPAKGRYREFYQCDVDAIGSKSMLVEAELCSAVSEILERLGFDDFVIRVNHRQLLAQIVETAQIPNDKTTDALIALDKLDKIGVEAVEKELINRGIGKKEAEIFISLFESFKGLEKAEKSEDGFDGFNQAFLNYWDEQEIKEENRVTGELRQLITFCENTLAKNCLKIDPSLARGLSYYTGAIFEIELTKGDFKGSICGGGRYDELVGMFGKEQIPAVGLSLGLERILYVMEERGMFPDDLQTNTADVMVTVWNEETASESLKLANELRQKNLRVLVYPNADKLGKQFKYADQINVKYVCVLGDNELAENTVSLKNLNIGKQEAVKREEIGEKVFNLLNQ